MTDLLSLGEAARRMGVPQSTLRRWIDRGKIRGHRTPGGLRRVSASVVSAYLGETAPETACPDCDARRAARGDLRRWLETPEGLRLRRAVAEFCPQTSSDLTPRAFDDWFRAPENYEFLCQMYSRRWLSPECPLRFKQPRQYTSPATETARAELRRRLSQGETRMAHAPIDADSASALHASEPEETNGAETNLNETEIAETPRSAERSRSRSGVTDE